MYEENVDSLLDKWYQTKNEIAELEKVLDKYKTHAERIMSSKNINVISNTKYSLTKREMNRSILAKDDVPKEVWNKYSKNINYNMFVIRKNLKN
jgi:hypothetical protein